MYLIVILSLWFILIFDIWMLCTKNLWCGKVITAWLTYIVCAIERMMWQFCFKASTTQKFHCHVTQAIVVRLKGRAAQLASLRRARVAPIELKCCTTIKWLSSSAVESQCALVLARSYTLLATRPLTTSSGLTYIVPRTFSSAAHRHCCKLLIFFIARGFNDCERGLEKHAW